MSARISRRASSAFATSCWYPVPIAEPRGALGGLAERPVQRRRELRRVSHDRHVVTSGVVERRADRADLAVHHAARARPCEHRPRPAHARCACSARRSGRCRPRPARSARRSGRGRCTRRGRGPRSRPRRRRTPRRSAAIARWPIPSGFQASDPSASLRAGTPNSMNAQHAALGDLDGLLAQRLERVLELTRHRGDRDGFADPLLREQRGDQLARFEASSRGSARAAPACGASGADGTRGTACVQGSGRPRPLARGVPGSSFERVPEARARVPRHRPRRRRCGGSRRRAP